MTFSSFPSADFPAEVVATAGAIDPTTRTLLTQLAVPNTDGKLFPGAYTNVHFQLESDSQSLLVPENVLLFREEGPAVGVVGPEGKVSIREIKINRDLGNTLQVQGLSESDQLIVNPSDSLADNDLVKIKPASNSHPGVGEEMTFAKKEGRTVLTMSKVNLVVGSLAFGWLTCHSRSNLST